jgi:isopentenyl phosphate kinase
MSRIELPNKNILLLKVGGSSITEKGKLETLDVEALEWFSRTIRLTINDAYLSADNGERIADSITGSDKPAIVIVHGAGSFGHHTAKRYGLGGKTSPPPDGMLLTKDLVTGLAKTRHRYVCTLL